jgi:aspartate kinase
MSLIVQKYGGTSVGSPERLQAVADRVVARRRAGHDVVVVVSAMGQATDELLALASQVTGRARPGRTHPREVDMLLTAGERVSMALLAMAIRERGEEAISLTGSQAAIITDASHTAARITEVRAERVREAVAGGKVVIVAGFQGVSREREITTLGRGGSDTTAVALAASLGADRCEVYTDVEGVFTADPRRIPGARVVRTLSHAEMVELAAAGAQVMHPRAIEIAARFDVAVRVLSSFTDPETDPETTGTLIVSTPEHMEGLVLTGIAASPGQAKLTLYDLPSGLRTATEVLRGIAEAGVSVDMISEAPGPSGMKLQISVMEDDLDDARTVCREVVERLGGGGVDEISGLTRITLVGSGMHDAPGVYARIFETLLEVGTELQGVSTSAISITVLVPSAHAESAMRALHDAFELEGAGAVPSAVAGEG